MLSAVVSFVVSPVVSIRASSVAVCMALVAAALADLVMVVLEGSHCSGVGSDSGGTSGFVSHLRFAK